MNQDISQQHIRATNSPEEVVYVTQCGGVVQCSVVQWGCECSHNLCSITSVGATLARYSSEVSHPSCTEWHTMPLVCLGVENYQLRSLDPNAPHIFFLSLSLSLSLFSLSHLHSLPTSPLCSLPQSLTDIQLLTGWTRVTITNQIK